MAQQEELTVESMLNDPRYQSLAKSNPALAEQLLSNYKRALQGDFSFEAAQPEQASPQPPAQAPEPSPAPGDQAFGNITPPENAPQEPGMLSNLASALTQSGGLLSPQATGMLAGGAAGAAGALPYGAALGPMGLAVAPLLGGIVGAGLGSIAGRGYEVASGMAKPAQPGVGGTLSDLFGAGNQGMTAQLEGEAGGQLLKGASQGIKTGLKYAAGQVGETLAKRKAARAATAAAGLEPGLAGEVTGNPQLSYLESLPGRFVFGVKQVAKFLDRREASNRAALVKLADERAPGALTDWTEIGNLFQGKAKLNEDAAVHLAGSMYDKAKQLVGPGRFPGSNLAAAAESIVNKEGSMGRFAGSQAGQARPFLDPNSTEGILAGAGYQPGERYSFDELVRLQQRIGNAVRRATSREQQADLLKLHAAVGNDMTAAAEEAGQPGAIELINQGKRLYTDKIMPTFRDPDVLRVLAKDPYNTAKTLMGPGATPDLLLNMRRAVGNDAWKQLSAAWQRSVLEDSLGPTGQFSPSKFLQTMKPYTEGGERKLRTLLGKQYTSFVGLMDEFAKQAAGGVGGISPEQLRGVLAQGQLIQVGKLGLGIGAATGLLTGSPSLGALSGLSGTAIAAGMPEALGRLLFSDKGIKWLTVGMKAQPGSFTASRALLKLTALAAGHGGGEGNGSEQ